METLGNNDIIIGLSDARKHNLTTVFKHVYRYTTEDEHETDTNSKSLTCRQALFENSQSPADRQGEDARASAAHPETSASSEAEHAKLQDPETLYQGYNLVEVFFA